MRKMGDDVGRGIREDNVVVVFKFVVLEDWQQKTPATSAAEVLLRSVGASLDSASRSSVVGSSGWLRSFNVVETR
jgi:hypothetical protein